MYTLILTAIVDMVHALSGLSSNKYFIICILEVKDEGAMTSLDSCAGCAFFVILEDASHGRLPRESACVNHFDPGTVMVRSNEAAVLSDETEASNTAENRFQELQKLALYQGNLFA